MLYTSAFVLTLEHIGSGKVREIYAVDDERLLIVASDRISAYDVIMPREIPDKGRVLTGLSVHWFDVCDQPHHLLSTDPADVPGIGEDARSYLAGRMMLVRRAEVIPMECVVRGYLYGSSWREYSSGGGPTTEHLPAGLDQGSKLETPIFTPATKAETGHDENLDEAGARALVGDDLYEYLKQRSIALYEMGNAYAAERGILLADTKFEFGRVGDEVILIDEILTPDSSRYWPAEEWRVGGTIPSFDKQFLREWLDKQPWDKEPPGPDLPDDVVAGIRHRYVEAYERLTGSSFDDYLSGGRR